MTVIDSRLRMRGLITHDVPTDDEYRFWPDELRLTETAALGALHWSNQLPGSQRAGTVLEPVCKIGSRASPTHWQSLGEDRYVNLCLRKDGRMHKLKTVRSRAAAARAFLRGTAPERRGATANAATTSEEMDGMAKKAKCIGEGTL